MLTPSLGFTCISGSFNEECISNYAKMAYANMEHNLQWLNNAMIILNYMPFWHISLWGYTNLFACRPGLSIDNKLKSQQ